MCLAHKCNKFQLNVQINAALLNQKRCKYSGSIVRGEKVVSIFALMKLQRMVVACGCCAGVQRRQGFGAKEMVNVYKNWEMNDSVQGNTPRCLVTTNDDTYFLNVTLDQVLQVDCQRWNGKSAYNLEIWVRQGLVGFPVSSRSVGFYSHLDAIVTIYGTGRA
ncbi:hypothetical protein T01_5255 [Trichinella spiralis]|uniref:Uncharacterized protein n=1 Tax=Trichinella spiralis TaxID=6334 RepID=A0A0V1BWQ1_TRISP|nr:hypothetical protein T01_5255 [Trichinella spiralis]